MRGSKTTEWILKLVDQVTGPLRDIASGATKSVERVAALQDHLDKLQDNSAMLSRSLLGLTAVAAGFGVMTFSSLKFDEGMAKVNATAQLTRPQLAALRSELIEIGQESGGNLGRIPESFEKIISQVNDANLSLEIVKESVAGAKAGFADLDVVAGALANTMSIVGRQNTSAREILDTFIQAKNLGGGEFESFAAYMPQLMSAGKALGISYKDVAGVFSFMTGKGNEAAAATMLILNAFGALMKEPVMKGLQHRGIQIFDKDGSIRNIGLIFTDLHNKLSGMSDRQQVKFFQDIGLVDKEARNAFILLASDTQKLTEILNGTNNAIGATNKALEVTGNPMRQIGDLADRFRGIMLQIVPAIYPTLTLIIDFTGWILSLIAAFVQSFPNFSAFIFLATGAAIGLGILVVALSLATTRYQIMITQIKLSEGPLSFFIRNIGRATLATWGFITASGSAILSLGRLVLGFAVTALQGVGSFIVGMISATAAMWGLNVAMYANPVGLVIIGLVAIGAAVFALIKYWDQVKDFLIEVGKILLKLNPFSWLFTAVTELFPGIKTWFSDLFSTIGDWFSKLWEKIQPIIKAIKGVFGFGGDTDVNFSFAQGDATGGQPAPGKPVKDPLSGLNMSGGSGFGGGSVSSDGGGFGKQLIMHLNVTQNNYFQSLKEGIDKVRESMTEAVVSGGRDGLTALSTSG